MRTRPTVPAFEEMSAAYVRYFDEIGNDIRVGLRLDELAGAAGLEVLAYRGWYNIVDPPPGVRPPPWWARDKMVAAGVVTQQDIDRWDAEFSGSARQPRIFAAMFGLVARKPA